MAQPQLAIEYAIVPESVGAVRGIFEKNKILPVARFRRDKFFLKRWGGFAYTPTFSRDIRGGFLGAGILRSPRSLAGRYSRIKTFSEVLGESQIHIIMNNH